MSKSRYLPSGDRRRLADSLASELCAYRETQNVAVGSDHLLWRIESFLNDVAFKYENESAAKEGWEKAGLEWQE